MKKQKKPRCKWCGNIRTMQMHFRGKPTFYVFCLKCCRKTFIEPIKKRVKSKFLIRQEQRRQKARREQSTRRQYWLKYKAGKITKEELKKHTAVCDPWYTFTWSDELPKGVNPFSRKWTSLRGRVTERRRKNGTDAPGRAWAVMFQES